MKDYKNKKIKASGLDLKQFIKEVFSEVVVDTVIGSPNILDLFLFAQNFDNRHQKLYIFIENI